MILWGLQSACYSLARYEYGLYSLPKLVPYEIEQLCWADAIFCKYVLSETRARLGST